MPRVIHLDESARQITAHSYPSEIDAVMRQVSEQLHETWQCARGSGLWYFHQITDGHRTVHNNRRKNFIQALVDATGASVAIIIHVR